MNPILKASLAAALTLGAVSAHAGFVTQTTSNPGDLVLFAEVLNSSGSLIGSYAGDTGVAVTSTGTAIASGETVAPAGGSANLTSLFNLAGQNGNTLVWSLEGGGQLSSNDFELADAGAAQFYSTFANNNISQVSARPSGVLDNWANIGNTLHTLNTNSGGASSVYGTAAASAGIFDTTSVSVNPANWYLSGGATGVTGANTAYNLYGITGTTTGPVAVSLVGTATLSANGVTFAAPVSAVPLPAAIWLLGSGLLGLAGVGRRKAVA